MYSTDFTFLCYSVGIRHVKGRTQSEDSCGEFPEENVKT